MFYNYYIFYEFCGENMLIFIKLLGLNNNRLNLILDMTKKKNLILENEGCYHLFLVAP